jgi:hypothetical protein
MELEPIIQKIGTKYDPVGIMSFVSDLGVVGVAGIAAAASIALITGACVAAVKSTMEWGLSLEDVSMKLGVTTESAAGLKLMSDAAGMSVDDFTRGLDIMAKNLVTVEGKEGSAGKALDSLHITFRNAGGTLRDSTEIFQDVADTLDKMDDGAQKTAYEMQIFGRSGTQMNEVLRLAARGGMEDFINQAKQMGLALSADQVDRIRTASVSINILRDSFKGVAAVVGIELVPFLQSSVNWIEKLVLTYLPGFEAVVKNIAGIFGMTLPSVPASAGAAASTIPSTWKDLGTLQGLGSAEVYAENYGTPLETRHTGAPPTTAASTFNPAARVEQEYAVPAKETALELALEKFAKDIAAIDWKTVGVNIEKGGVAIGKAADWMMTTFFPAVPSNTIGGFKPGEDDLTPVSVSFGDKAMTAFGVMMDKVFTFPIQNTVKELITLYEDLIKADLQILFDPLLAELVLLPGQIASAVPKVR